MKRKRETGSFLGPPGSSSHPPPIRRPPDLGLRPAEDPASRPHAIAKSGPFARTQCGIVGARLQVARRQSVADLLLARRETNGDPTSAAACPEIGTLPGARDTLDREDCRASSKSIRDITRKRPTESGGAPPRNVPKHGRETGSFLGPSLSLSRPPPIRQPQDLDLRPTEDPASRPHAIARTGPYVPAAGANARPFAATHCKHVDSESVFFGLRPPQRPPDSQHPPRGRDGVRPAVHITLWKPDHVRRHEVDGRDDDADLPMPP